MSRAAAPSEQGGGVQGGQGPESVAGSAGHGDDFWVSLEHFTPMPLFHSLLETSIPSVENPLLSTFSSVPLPSVADPPVPTATLHPVGPLDALSTVPTCRVHSTSRVPILLAISVCSVRADLLPSLSSIFYRQLCAKPHPEGFRPQLWCGLTPRDTASVAGSQADARCRAGAEIRFILLPSTLASEMSI